MINTLNNITIKITGALLIIIAGFIIGRLLGLLTQRLLKELGLDIAMRKITGQPVKIEKIIAGITSAIIYTITIIMALNYLGLTTILLTIIVASALIITLISLLLAIKDFLPNALAGIIIKYKGEITEGKKIKIKGIEGTIKEINLTTTKIMMKEDLIIIPNSLFQKEKYIIKEEKNKKKTKKKKE